MESPGSLAGSEHKSFQTKVKAIVCTVKNLAMLMWISIVDVK